MRFISRQLHDVYKAVVYGLKGTRQRLSPLTVAVGEDNESRFSAEFEADAFGVFGGGLLDEFAHLGASRKGDGVHVGVADKGRSRGSTETGDNVDNTRWKTWKGRLNRVSRKAYQIQKNNGLAKWLE